MEKENFKVFQIDIGNIDKLLNNFIFFRKELNKIIPENFRALRGKQKSKSEVKKILMKDFLNNDYRCFGVEKDNKYIGFVMINIKFLDNSIYGGYKYGEIGCLWVDPNFRSKGVSTLLKEKCLEYLKENNCKELRLNCLINNSAKEIYKNWGVQEYMIVMKKIL